MSSTQRVIMHRFLAKKRRQSGKEGTTHAFTTAAPVDTPPEIPNNAIRD
jgi:hypothetical protein